MSEKRVKHTLEFKVHEPPDGHTRDLTLRVSAIANGWVIKAGGAPFFCATSEILEDAIEDVLERFVDETATKAP